MNEDDALEPTLHALPELASRPDGDVLARAFSKARIENLLFEANERVTLGRYHLLARIGAGGMGTVWGALDPELDRKVAIKLLREELAADHERMIAEGQALAKLAHPNVVAVHDVGVVGEQVYVVMEWIHGRTLRDYARDASPRDILAAYRAAGDGLAAAHAANLVHRDFKPDNVMVGDDGRVRVLDFGLARGDVAGATTGGDTATRGAGTPRYMAPEQADGGELTPAADQFAFCVSLRESLDGAVPKWVQLIVARGTAANPALRYPSMRALLDALAKDPAVIWRRRLFAAGAVAVAGAAFAIGSLRAGDEVERCSGGEAEIAKVWNPRRATELVTHLNGLGAYGATEAERVTTVLWKQSRTWSASHREACLARDRGELTPRIYEQRLACLGRTRAAFGAIVEVLAATEENEQLANAAVALKALPAPGACTSHAETSTEVPPPEAIAARVTEVGLDVERARTRALALTPDSIDFAKATASSAAMLGFPPLIARADLEVARATWTRRYTDALPLLPGVLREGLEAGNSIVAVEAYAMELRALIGLDEVPANFVERITHEPTMEALAKGLGPHGASARAFLYNNIGNRFMTEGKLEQARTMFTRALDERLEPLQRAQILQNLAIATEDPATAEKRSGESVDLFIKEVGADHPETLTALISDAMLLREPERVLEKLRPPCERITALHPHVTSQQVRCWFELGAIAEELGRTEEARAAMSAVPMDKDIRRELADGYVLYLDGKHAEALARFLDIAERMLRKPKSNARERGALALILAARCQLALEQRPSAIETLVRAEEALAGITDMMQTRRYQRDVARVQGALAKLARAADPAKARLRAREAARWYRASGQSTLADELEAIARDSK